MALWDRASRGTSDKIVHQTRDDEASVQPPEHGVVAAHQDEVVDRNKPTAHAIDMSSADSLHVDATQHIHPEHQHPTTHPLSEHQPVDAKDDADYTGFRLGHEASNELQGPKVVDGFIEPSAVEGVPDSDADGRVGATEPSHTGQEGSDVSDDPAASANEQNSAETANGSETIAGLDSNLLPVDRRIYVQQNIRGDQDGLVIGVQNNFTEPIDCRPYGGDDLFDRVSKLFEPPEGFGEIKRWLTEGYSPVVVLAGKDDCGRDFAADALLLSRPDLRPRDIGPLSKLNVKPRALAAYPRSAWRLDLTDIEGVDWDKQLTTLAGLASDLRSHGSTLVGVVNRSDLTGAQVNAFEIVAELTTYPNAYEVLRRHLDYAADTLGDSNRWVNFAKAEHLLDQAAPSEAVRLQESILESIRYWNRAPESERVNLIQRFRKSGEFGVADDNAGLKDAERSIELLALGRFKSWESELKAWNETYQDHPQLKAFQVAVAVLPSADLKTVHQAAVKLRRDVGERNPEQLGLVGIGTHLLAEKALAKLESGQAGFDRPGFAEAVVRYFWDDWPQFHSEFLGWMMDLAAGEGVEAGDRNAIQYRIGTFAIRHAEQRDDFTFLDEVITAWADNMETLDPAVQLLERAVTTAGIHRRMYTKMLDWVKGKSSPRRTVVGKVCAREAFALQHPALAITRLSYLTEDEAFPDRDMVEACRLLIRDGKYVDQVLDWIKRGIDSTSPELQQRASRMFLAVARICRESSPVPILLEEGIKSRHTDEKLVSMWARVLRTPHPDEASETFRSWMDVCLEEYIKAFVFGVFAKAVFATEGGCGRALMKIARLLEGWRTASQLPTDRVAALYSHLDAVLDEADAALTARPSIVPDEITNG